MNFDSSKENIQPLRGGRNAQQLEVALQAQTYPEALLRLLARKAVFEADIRNYKGDDPLEPFFNYIVWIEQSFPKSGHEGHCRKILEHCLGLYEDDPRYANDRRFCKLWIKFNDYYSNPPELYLMMKSKNICTGFAEFYKAWAYYHEMAGDFQKASHVLEEGMKNLAQPYEELEIAQKNLFAAYEEAMVNGSNLNRLQARLRERREAMTSVHTFRHGRVGSVRIPSSNPRTTLRQSSTGEPSAGGHSNTAFNVYEDQSSSAGASSISSGAAPSSIVTSVRSQVAPNENVLAPGVWPRWDYGTGTGYRTKVQYQFTVLDEDGNTEMEEDFSVFDTVPLTLPDMLLPYQSIGYSMEKVYRVPGEELCLEEIEMNTRLENEEAQRDASIPLVVEEHQAQSPQRTQDHQSFLQDVFNRSNEPGLSSYPDETSNQGSSPMKSLQAGFSNVSVNLPRSVEFQILEDDDAVEMVEKPRTPDGIRPRKIQAFMPVVDLTEPSTSKANSQALRPLTDATAPSTSKIDNYSTKNDRNSSFQCFDIDWEDDNSPLFKPQEQSPTPVVRPKSVKTNAFRELTVDELVETGSRHGGAMADQPTDEAKNMEDDEIGGGGDYLNSTCSTQQFNFSLNEAKKVSTAQRRSQVQKSRRKGPRPDQPADVRTIEDDEMGGGGGDYLDDTCSTQQFFFNLNETKKTSTPQRKNQIRNRDADAQNETSKFPKPLSTIMEESKSSYASSSSSGVTSKSMISSQHKMSTISEEHTANLQQNLMANAELRRSLLGILDTGDIPVPSAPSPQHFVVPSSHDKRSPFSRSPAIHVQPAVSLSQLEVPPSHDQSIPLPLAKGQPLDSIPTDPFRASLLETLLDRVNFPGVHEEGYVPIEGCPRLTIRSSSIHISREEYVIEKLLGKGMFGTVYKALDCRKKTYVALKLQKPPNKWEFYVCRELAARLQNHELRDRFMNISLGYFSSQCSILVSKYEPFGSLLDLVNALKVNSTRTREPLCLYITLEMMRIVKAMHEVKIIHADIKPDNFLVVPQGDCTIKLQLIDFGCGIDMTLFPEGATFRKKIDTDNFVCCEVLDRRPWSYHTDLFCIAASAHVLLFYDYIELKKVEDSWSISARLPRYCQIDLWNMFFSSLLNQQSGPADIATLELLFSEQLQQGSCKKDLPSQIRHVVNLLKKR